MKIGLIQLWPQIWDQKVIFKSWINRVYDYFEDLKIFVDFIDDQFPLRKCIRPLSSCESESIDVLDDRVRRFLGVDDDGDARFLIVSSLAASVIRNLWSLLVSRTVWDVSAGVSQDRSLWGLFLLLLVALSSVWSMDIDWIQSALKTLPLDRLLLERVDTGVILERGKVGECVR